MPAAVRPLVLSGLDRFLRARGVEERELPLARSEAKEWARVRARALRRLRGVVRGLRIVVLQPGRAELRPFDLTVGGRDEVTVEILASAISTGTERAQWLRLPNAQPTFPFTPGYSGAGVVLSSGVDGLSPGTLVAVPRAPHASVVTVPASWVTAVPEGVPARAAALVYLAVIAGYGVRRAASVSGVPVCILGAGPIGALTQRLLMLRDPGAVTIVAKSRRAEASALRAGAARFVQAHDGAGDIDAAVVIEATGDPGALPVAVAAARPGGTIVILGSPRGVTPDAALAEVHRKGLSLVGAHVSALATEARLGSTDPFRELSLEFLDAVAAGRLEVDDLVGDALDPREPIRWYRSIARHDVAAAHLDWSLVPRSERIRNGVFASLPQRRPEEGAARSTQDRATHTTGRRVRFAVVGCGDIGYLNARAIAAAANADVTLCYDPVPGLAATAARDFGGEATDSLDEALDPERADAVILSVPHDLHAPLAIPALRAGLHVIVEKPLAVDLRSAEEMVASAAEAGVWLSVCFHARYYPEVQAARQLVQAGALGTVRGAAVLFHADKPMSYWTGGFSGRSPSAWRASRDRSGGGVLIMNVVHHLDLLRFVAGAETESVAGVALRDEDAEVEDAVALSVGFVGGAIGSVSASASTRGAPETRFEIWGDAGTVRLEPDAAFYTDRAVAGALPGRWASLPSAPVDETRRIFVEQFAAAVFEGREPDVTPADGLAVQAFVDAAYRAVESGERIDVVYTGVASE